MTPVGSGCPRPHYMPPIKGACKKEDSANHESWKASKKVELLDKFLKEMDVETLNRIAFEDPKIIAEWANFAIFLKVREGAIKEVEYLRTLGVQVNVIASDGSTLLGEAIFAGQFEMVEYLLAHKAPLILDPTTHKNVFHLACELGLVKIILRLLECMDPKDGLNWLNFEKTTPEEQLVLISAFLARDSILPSTLESFNDLLTVIVVSQKDDLIRAVYRQLVIQASRDSESIPISPNQLFVHAYECYKSRFPDKPYPIKLVTALLELGVPVDSLALNGIDTLYFKALIDEDRELIDFFKSRRANLNYKIELGEDKVLYSRLEYEIAHRNYGTVVMMMQNGALFSEIGETDEEKDHFWSQLIVDFFDQLKDLMQDDPVKVYLIVGVVDRFIQFLKQIKIEIKSEGPIVLILKKKWESFYHLEGEDETDYAENVDSVESLNQVLVDIYAKGREELGEQLLLGEIIEGLSRD